MKLHFAWGVAASLIAGAPTLAASPAQSDFDKTAVADAVAAIEKSCGKKIAISVTWENFGDDVSGQKTFTDAGLGFLTGAMAETCKNAAMKKEVAKQIDKIVVAQAYGAADPMIYINERALNVEFLWAEGQGGPDLAFVKTEIVSRLKGEEMEAP